MYFLAPDGKLMAVDVRPQHGTFEEELPVLCSRRDYEETIRRAISLRKGMVPGFSSTQRFLIPALSR